MKSPSLSPDTPPSRPARRWTSCIATVAMIAFAATSVSAQTTILETQPGGGALPDGWTSENNITTNAIDRASYWLVDAGNPGDFIISSDFDLSTYSSVTISVNVATFGSGAANPLRIEYSTDGGVTWNPNPYNTATPSSSTYIAGGPVIIPASFSATTKLRFSAGGTSGRGVRIQQLGITASLPDNTSPTIVTYSPDNGTSNVPLTTTQLVATFDENVDKGTSGNITVKRAADDSVVMTIPVTDPAVEVSGATATITLPASFDATTGYYVNIDASAFKDLAENNFTGISDNSTWAFTTATTDIISPAVVTLEPTGANAMPASNLVITYDEAILEGNGTVTIKKTSDSSVVETITVPSAQVSLSGNTATLDPSTVLDYGTGYYVEVSAGAFTDLSANDCLAISGSSTWSFTTRSVPAVVISQYYEGLNTDRFIKLKNLTGSPVSLDGYRVVAWSDTPPSDNEGWKSGTNTSTRITDLAGYKIPANGTFLIASDTATAPAYAVANNDLLDNGGCTAINGDDSVVLYFSGTEPLTFTQQEVVDAVSLPSLLGADTSFYRLNNGVGYDFNIGSSILDFPSAWGTKTLAEVDNALETDDWYLLASVPIETLTLSISPTSAAESAGTAAATATVTRSGDTSSALTVIIDNNRPGAASAALSVEITAGQSSATFPIDLIDNQWLTGDSIATFTVSAEHFLPASATLTVLDDSTDQTYPVVINELDSDTPSTDVDEFVELYNNYSEPIALDGLVLVLYNGDGGDVSYSTIDLTGYTIPANGFFVIGSNSVPNVDLIAFNSNGLQNGADGVALQEGSASGPILDALVYDTSDADDLGLLAALMPEGALQINEDANGASDTESIARVPDGGVHFDTSVFVVQAPTPGTTNVPSTGNTFADWIGGFDFSAYPGADLSPSGDADNDGVPNAVENILGTSPAAFSQGLSTVSASGGNLVFRHTLSATPASNLQASYEWSVNLANWQASGVAAGGTTVTFGAPAVITPGTPDLVEVTATVTGTTPTKIFVRLQVE